MSMQSFLPRSLAWMRSKKTHEPSKALDEMTDGGLTMINTPTDPANSQQGPGEPAERESFRWVPIRSLAARHRPRILKHLLALGDGDRYLRFGSAATDAQIAHYVDLIDFESDEVFGIFNRRLDLMATAHLAMGRPEGRDPTREKLLPTAEFGVSVLANARGRGYGSRLFDRSVLHARNRGIKRLVIHALSENKVMLGIARKAGAAVVRDGSESQAELELPPDNVSSHVEAFVEQAVGEIDFRIKAQAYSVGELLSNISEVSTLKMPRREAEATAPEPGDKATKSRPR